MDPVIVIVVFLSIFCAFVVYILASSKLLRKKQQLILNDLALLKPGVIYKCMTGVNKKYNLGAVAVCEGHLIINDVAGLHCELSIDALRVVSCGFAFRLLALFYSYVLELDCPDVGRFVLGLSWREGKMLCGLIREKKASPI